MSATLDAPSAAPAGLPLTVGHIRLGRTAANKTEAIRAVGQLLVDEGIVDPGYSDSLLAREEQANTYLGNGIAIPHGRPAERHLIHRTGIVVVQFPAGVEWKPGQRVHVAIGIAARGDEHLELLAALTDVLDRPETAASLATTTDPQHIIDSLRRRPAPEAPAADAWHGAPFVEVTIRGHAGLHARPSTHFADLANDFAADIRVHCGERSANGKAMASLLRLGATGGAQLRIEARGSDAALALTVLKEAVEAGLGDVDEPTPPISGQPWTPPENSPEPLRGVSASPGLAIAPTFRFAGETFVVTDDATSPSAERSRLEHVIARAGEDLQQLCAASLANVVPSESEIFRAHHALLNDPELRDEVLALIDQGHSAPWAWQHIIARREEEVRQLANARLAGRAADLRDIGRRVLRLFTGASAPEPRLPAEPCVLIADDLTPSDTARLDPQRILGLCTAAGGPTSHTAIIARARGIPAVVGVGPALLNLVDGTPVVLDGNGGALHIAPDDAALASARTFQAAWKREQAMADSARYQPALTRDGHRVEIVANIGAASEAAEAVEAGAEGVGLLRTEFLFLGRDHAPSEEEQFLAYSEMTRALGGLPLIIRTLDIGGDKVVPYLDLAKEENPFLGVRGIRLCLRRPELFKEQLRAIYRTAAVSEPGSVKIMFPMVTSLEDLRAGRALAGEVRASLKAPVVDIGIMVEVPSVALLAREFAREADFFSVGTNDLTQYALAIDRQHPELGKEADALHPAVLRLIDLTVRGAVAEGKWVGVCGGAAGDPFGATLLTGLGVAELSMSQPSISGVKARLRSTTRVAARALAQRALACATAAEVRALA